MKTQTTNRVFYLAAALISLALAEVPLFQGKGYLFSAHMVTHILLLLITAPLFVLALGQRPAGGRANAVSRQLSAIPWLNWLAGVGIMWLWHIPGLFNALLASEDPAGQGHLPVLSLIHTCSLLLAGFLFAWPLAGPIRRHRLSPPEAILYLSTACVSCLLLGLLITFARPGLYVAGISKFDQQLAGFMMWAPCCLLYLGGVVYLLREWLGEENIWTPRDFYRKNRKWQRQKNTFTAEEPAPAPPFRSGVIIAQVGIIDPPVPEEAGVTAQVAL
jgi:putative membrane protein